MTGLQSITDDYTIAFWRKDMSDTAPVHIYIEGDGHAFDGYGRPTADPTPRSSTVRDLALRDAAPNVVYMARPCQYIMSPSCNVHDWTDGRFSENIITDMSNAVKFVARGRPIVLVGYSGGAMITGLIIKNNPDINVKKWVTVAGVLNHADWTQYFGDAPLSHSLNMDVLPHVSQLHYVAEKDKVVPVALSRKWTGGNMEVIKNATHGNLKNIELNLQ